MFGKRIESKQVRNTFPEKMASIGHESIDPPLVSKCSKLVPEDLKIAWSLMWSAFSKEEWKGKQLDCVWIRQTRSFIVTSDRARKPIVSFLRSSQFFSTFDC